LQEFATTVEQLVYRACSALPEDHIRREAGKAFADGEDPAIKIQEGQKAVKEALRQAVILAVRNQKTSARTYGGSRSSPTGRRDQTRSTYWNCGKPSHFRDNCPYGRETENDDRSGNRQEGPNGNREKTDRRSSQPSGNDRVPAEKAERRSTH
jgi:hypothetical protein